MPIQNMNLRTPHDISALSKCFQMTIEESFDAISKIPQEIIETNDNKGQFRC